MQMNKNLEQQVAVFGESGSGKTVLLSSFYGVAQEASFQQDNHYYLLAEKLGQGNRLHKNYLGMKNSASVPMTDHMQGDSYAFSVKVKDAAKGQNSRTQPIDALRVVWHDYPGEWFESDVSGELEHQNRVDTFRSLLASDVALLLVDGQRLLDNAGEEERYLKSLFANLRNSVLSMKDDLLVEGRPLVQFPRIWVLALSKADLLPDMDVYAFRDMLIEKSSEEISDLQQFLSSMVEGSQAFSFGEDFMLLSSAKFEPGRIVTSERMGVDLLLPLVAMLPFERNLKWAKGKELPAKLAEMVVRNAGTIAGMILLKSPAKLLKFIGFLGIANNEKADFVFDAAADQLKEMNDAAIARKDLMAATLTQFQLDLEEGEATQVLKRSQR